MKTKIFTPVESMNPIYLGAAENLYSEVLVEHHGKTFAEIKEDGYRMQIHKKGAEVRGYTRSMNQFYLELLPELSSSLRELPDGIFDCELIGDGEVGHEGFDMVKRRFRSRIGEQGIKDYLESGVVGDYPLAIRVFDTLHWEKRGLLGKPLEERRKYTEKVAGKKISPSEKRLITDPEKLQAWFESLTGDNYEGLVCKNPESKYLPGDRTKDWIKLKRSETLDLVVLGVYMQEGQIGQILCGTYNPDDRKFETLAKVNAKREGMNQELMPLLEENFLEYAPRNVRINPELKKREDQIPDYFLNPRKSVVVEVAAMNFHHTKNRHSCGLDDAGKSYSLRIAWLKSIRQDKAVKDTVTTRQVINHYLNERGG